MSTASFVIALASLGLFVGGYNIWAGLAGNLASRDARLLLIMVGAVLGQALATLVLLAALTNVVVVWRVVLSRDRS